MNHAGMNQNAFSLKNAFGCNLVKEISCFFLFWAVRVLMEAEWLLDFIKVFSCNICIISILINMGYFSTEIAFLLGEYLPLLLEPSQCLHLEFYKHLFTGKLIIFIFLKLFEHCLYFCPMLPNNSGHDQTPI